MADNIIIPPRPQALLSVQDLMKSEDPDIDAIASVIKSDISLYTILLSAVNNPWVGLAQPATSVEQAIMLLGLDRVFTLLQAVSVRTSFAKCSLPETFWSTAIEVAGICSDLSNRHTGMNRNLAYSTGMLHNAGIAVMNESKPGFKAFIKEHEFLSADELCVRERKQYNTDHYLQGALMARKWFLGDEVALAIRYQPIASLVLTGQKSLAESATSHLAVLTLAKNISSEYRRYWLIDEQHADHIYALDLALDYLHINHSDYDEFKEDKLDEFNNRVSA